MSHDLGRFPNLQEIPIGLAISEFDPVINSLFAIPDPAATFVELLHFLLYSSVFSILQFLSNLLRSIPGEDGSSSPIHYTSVFFHSELDLPIEWLPAKSSLRFKLSSRLNEPIF